MLLNKSTMFWRDTCKRHRDCESDGIRTSFRFEVVMGMLQRKNRVEDVDADVCRLLGLGM